MILLDKASHPRPKLCGGGVTRLGLEILNNLDLPDPLPIPHAVVNDARFVYRNRTVHVRGKPEFIVFDRQEFDAYLAQTARDRGVRICEGEAVQSIQKSREHVLVRSDSESYQAQVLVGADGSKGVVYRNFRNSKKPSRVARLLEVVQPVSEDSNLFRQEYAKFDFNEVDSGLQGYVWNFPARVAGVKHHNKGVYDARVVRHRPLAGLLPIVNKAISEPPIKSTHPKIQGHPIHLFSPQNVFSKPRVVLVGDAVGAEPLFGEGIAPALWYGKIAAQAIHDAFRSSDFSFRTYKRRVLLSRLGAYLMLRWGIAWWSYRLSEKPWFMHTMWTLGRGLAAITNRV